jgi:exopolyphosphatase/guanosine-5'-triphosphate,3'-diphosphate pyrophosphatase
MKLATRLFAALQPGYDLGQRDLLLLRVAALLHDVGHVVGPSKHHKHSYYLIRNSELMGVSDDELDVIANIARFHRKSAPGPGHDEFAELVRSDKHRVKKLAAILRVADSLDREHKQQVEDMVCEAGAGRLRLTLRSSSDCLLERWALEERSGMFNDVFKLGIETRLEPAPARSGPANGLYSRSYSAVVGKGPAAGNGPSGR